MCKNSLTSDIQRFIIVSMKTLKINEQKVKAEMKRQGLTYQALGDKLHISRQAVGYYFYNRSRRALTLRTVSRLAWALNCDPKDLLI